MAVIWIDSGRFGRGYNFLDPANIGQPVEGGFFAGLISHTADGNPTHALIVAPRDTGASGTGYALTTNLPWKTVGTTTAGATSEFDGVANTAAIVTAGIVDHPAAQFCVDLSIGGHTDWYLPAIWELDIAYFNLKPTTASNSLTDGANPYSVPRRNSPYTAGAPAQTSVSAFQANQAQALIGGVHWASNENSATTAWEITFVSGSQNSSNPKTSTTRRTRAFRRVAL
jgi:hypothetical protein